MIENIQMLKIKAIFGNTFIIYKIIILYVNLYIYKAI